MLRGEQSVDERDPWQPGARLGDATLAERRRMLLHVGRGVRACELDGAGDSCCVRRDQLRERDRRGGGHRVYANTQPSFGAPQWRPTTSPPRESIVDRLAIEVGDLDRVRR